MFSELTLQLTLREIGVRVPTRREPGETLHIKGLDRTMAYLTHLVVEM